MAEEQVIEEWIICINNDMAKLAEKEPEETWRKQSIYRVPESVRNMCKRAYTPQKVSIGPYHHGDHNLKGMEEHKHRALLHFLRRSRCPLKVYMDVLFPMVEDLKDAYDQLDERWRIDNGAFLKLMIVDGCFILELLRLGRGGMEIYALNDPVFSEHGKLNYVPYLKPDMLMLENQIPLPLLTTLLDVEQGKPTDKLALELICEFFSPFSSNIKQLRHSLHILDVYRKSLLLARPPHRKAKASGVIGDQYIRPATELDQAGIRFRRSKARGLNDISFHGGVVQLPPTEIDDTFESLYLNLMAFERFHVGAGNQVTSFVFFINSLIYNERDVSLLNKCGIIKSALGSDRAVARLFNSLSRDVVVDPESSVAEVYDDVVRYSQNKWRVWRAEFIRNYFPSKRIELSAYLFILTVVQTTFGILSYRPK